MLSDTLKQLNAYIMRLQQQTADYYGHDLVHDYIDSLWYSEHQGLFDVIWYGGDYGTQSFSYAELPSFEEDQPLQHCGCKCEDPSECECEYEGQGLSWLIDVLLQYPEKIRSLAFTGPDAGSNGLREWGFSRLLEHEVSFPNLSTLKVQLQDAGNHNLVLIGDTEGGEDHSQVTQLLKTMPHVARVELPTTPDAHFFTAPFPNLQHLRIQACHDSQYFIRRLAASPLLNQISLDFTDVWHDDELSYVSSRDREILANINHKAAVIAAADDPVQAQKDAERQLLKEAGYSDAEIALDLDQPNRSETLRLLKICAADETEIKDTMAYYESINRWDADGEYRLENDEADADDWTYQPSPSYQKRTSLGDYAALFTSQYMRSGFHFKLREGYLTQAELFHLQNLNTEIQFLHIPTTQSYYVSHRIEDQE